MLSLLLPRLGECVATVFLVASATLVLHHLLPGAPTELSQSPRLRPDGQEHLMRAFGLDSSISDRYTAWLRRAAHGEPQVSLSFQRPVLQVIAPHLAASTLLAAGALTTALALALLLGLAAAAAAGSRLDGPLRLVCLMLYSLPSFWLGVMTIAFFSFHLRILPPGHMLSADIRGVDAETAVGDLVRHLLLPSLVLGAGIAGGLARFLRNSLLDVLSRDFIRTARAAGVPPSRIVCRHALPAALAPVIQVLGLWLPAVASGALVTEVVFSWPGLGRLTYTAILARDYPLVVSATAWSSILVVIGGLSADLLHVALDPRLAARA